jgi:hypothetical protein
VQGVQGVQDRRVHGMHTCFDHWRLRRGQLNCAVTSVTSVASVASVRVRKLIGTRRGAFDVLRSTVYFVVLHIDIEASLCLGNSKKDGSFFEPD